MINKNGLLKIAISIGSLLLALSWSNNNGFAVERGIGDNPNPVYIQDKFKDAGTSDGLTQVDYTKKFSPYSETSKSLRGGISQLISISGKSQLIRFDEPVKRVSVANPNLADIVLLSRKEILINGKTAGKTSLIFWGQTGDPVFFDLVVKNDTTSFLEDLKTIAPDEHEMDIRFSDLAAYQSAGGPGPSLSANTGSGAVSTAGQNKSVIVSGKISSTIIRDRIRDLATAYGYNFVNLAESQNPQILLEVKIVEASRSYTRNLTTDTTGGTSLDPGQISFFVNPFKNTNLSLASGTVAGSELPNLTLGRIRVPILNSRTNLNLKESKGQIRVLAEPKLVAVNKQTASFNAGQQIPVPEGVDPETGLINYGYKDVGVNLSFTPEILDQSGKILLKLTPEVNEIDSTITVRQANGITIYGMKTRKTDTTVELDNGQTLVIAGLLQRNDTVSSDQVPFLGDIPILGSLFSSREWRKGETELLIFVTPKILKSNNKVVNGV